MELLGLEPEQCAFDYSIYSFNSRRLTIVLDGEMASLIAPEFGFEVELDEQAGFDLYPQ